MWLKEEALSHLRIEICAQYGSLSKLSANCSLCKLHKKLTLFFNMMSSDQDVCIICMHLVNALNIKDVMNLLFTPSIPTGQMLSRRKVYCHHCAMIVLTTVPKTDCLSVCQDRMHNEALISIITRVCWFLSQ